MKRFHIHLVSDATGETINVVARACLVQFEGVDLTQHVWSMMRTRAHLEKTLAGIKAHPGVVLFTLVDKELRHALQDGCEDLGVPCIPVLDPVIAALGDYLSVESRNVPGGQHMMDAEYFARIDAMKFVLNTDDGQATEQLDKADIIIVGVSRTSKTPTCIYLANRGIKAANVPLVPGRPLPPNLGELTGPMVVGLTVDPNILIQVRRNRLKMMHEKQDTDYTDPELVMAEVTAARRLYQQHGWPILDVTRRSIEETAAAIIQLYTDRKKPRAKAAAKS